MKHETAKFLNSLTAIVIPMIILLFAFVIDASVLFYRAFPTDMPEALKLVASSFLGFAIAFPLLLTAVNRKLLAKFGETFPIVFAVFSAIMTAFFFDVFAAEGKDLSWYWLVGFLSVFVGLIDYLYAHLFVEKFAIEVVEELASDQLAVMTSAFNVLDRKYSQLEHSAAQLKDKSSQYDALRLQLTCKYCKTVKSPGTISSHQSNCKKKHDLKVIENGKAN